mmetsp:Transcript_65971/g.153306  ORF Transcript_65971/g.153306 Transcript_65971/m.153306 type:complete len:206 (-) Transcript_65971:5-622(-)
MEACQGLHHSGSISGLDTDMVQQATECPPRAIRRRRVRHDEVLDAKHREARIELVSSKEPLPELRPEVEAGPSDAQALAVEVELVLYLVGAHVTRVARDDEIARVVVEGTIHGRQQPGVVWLFEAPGQAWQRSAAPGHVDAVPVLVGDRAEEVHSVAEELQCARPCEVPARHVAVLVEGADAFRPLVMPPRRLCEDVAHGAVTHA